jgi:hypothetical protein
MRIRINLSVRKAAEIFAKRHIIPDPETYFCRDTAHGKPSGCLIQALHAEKTEGRAIGCLTGAEMVIELAGRSRFRQKRFAFFVGADDGFSFAASDDEIEPLSPSYIRGARFGLAVRERVLPGFFMTQRFRPRPHAELPPRLTPPIGSSVNVFWRGAWRYGTVLAHGKKFSLVAYWQLNGFQRRTRGVIFSAGTDPKYRQGMFIVASGESAKLS